MGLVLAIVAAFASALCYGVASVLQSIAAHRSPASEGLDPRFLASLLRQTPYVAGLTLDLVGFVASVVALQRLPLFFVQAAVASSVGVTVVLAVVVLKQPLPGREVVALAGLGVGLLLLALAARPDAPTAISRAGQFAILIGVGVVAIFGLVASRQQGASSAAWLAVGAGLGFSGIGVAARALVLPHSVVRLAGEPLAWAIAGYGVLATLLFATALQRGSVTTAAALTFAVETVIPAVLGLTLLGDHARQGFAAVAGAGFVLTVTGAMTLARHAAPATGAA
jgi:drug/metabolite transporter (DMT)-like permease